MILGMSDIISIRDLPISINLEDGCGVGLRKVRHKSHSVAASNFHLSVDSLRPPVSVGI